MPLISTNGVRHYLAELGDGPPVFMLHGLFVGNLASWYFTCAASLAEKHRVIMYDLRGHGRSERPRSGYDVSTMTADLEGLIDAMTAATPEAPVRLVGHSYGALISLEYARRHPGRVEKLVVVEAPLAPEETGELTSFMSREPDEMLAALPAELRAEFDKGSRRARKLLSSLEFLATETTLLEDLERRGLPSDEELAAVRCPVLSVYGDQSPCLASATRLEAKLPDATSILLPGGHFLPLDAPEELSRALVEFLDG